MFENFLVTLEKFFIASPHLGFFISFLAGIIVSFSTCIYPLIPITLSIVGATSTSSRLKGFSISLIFILGIATTYTVLGIIASLFGIFLHKFFINPVTYIFLTIIFFVLGLSLLGVIKFNIFSFSSNYQPKKTMLSLFVLGMISSLAIIPCNFPVLGAILTLISFKRSVFYGAISLLFFSLGYGLLLIILGIFSSLLIRLPKTGLWLIIIKKITGIILIIMSLYFFFKFITLK